MNQIELYHYIFLISSALAGLFSVVSIVMFFTFDIQKLIGMKTGKSKRKSIEQLKQFQSRENEKKNKRISFLMPQTEMRHDNITTKLQAKEVVTEALDIHVNQKKATGFVVVSEIMEIHSDKLIDGL